MATRDGPSNADRRRTTMSEQGPGLAPDFDTVWPEVAKRLRGFLRKRGATGQDADDLIQTVAERALRNAVPFDSADDLLHWCLTVARNLDVDRWRAAGRRDESCLDEMSEPREQVSLEDRVLTRLRLMCTVEALKLMRPKDRQMLLSGLDTDQVASGKDRVARHRARLRLLELVGPPSLVVVAFCRRLMRPLARPGSAALGAVTAGFALLVVGASVIPYSPTTGAPNVTRAVLEVPERSGTGPIAAPSARAARTQEPPAAGRRRFTRIASPERTLLQTDQRGTVRLTGHDRRPQDAGVVCVRHLPVLADTCVGPTSLPKNVHPTVPAMSATTTGPAVT